MADRLRNDSSYRGKQPLRGFELHRRRCLQHRQAERQRAGHELRVRPQRSSTGCLDTRRGLNMRENFLTIPDAPRYEINSDLICRVKATGQILTLQIGL